jgi:Holliday junction resolvase RusA-like endonuclease
VTLDPGIIQYSVDLLPFIQIRKEHEVERAAKARKRTKIKKISVRFPSVNTMYGFNRFSKRRFLSSEGKDYKEYLAKALDKSGKGVLPHCCKYDVTYLFFMTEEMLFKKNGDIAEHDVSNFLKATEDALFEWMMESDSAVMGVHGYKRLTVNDPKLVILISKSCETDVVYHNGNKFDPYDLEASP